MNLQPETEGWNVLWNMVIQFRSIHSDEWFVPTVQELQQVCSQKSYLNNLSTSSDWTYYHSSSEFNSSSVYDFYFSFETEDMNNKYVHTRRTRLCRYATDAELNKKTWILNEIITSTELNRIENRIQTIHSSYSPTTWNPGDVLSKDRLNKIETQIGSDKVWEDGNIVTVDDLNNIENLLS